MDLARMILDVSKEQYQKECVEEACDIDICLNDRYKYSIKIVPLKSQLLICYKTIKFKIDRADKASYEELIEFLIQEIKDNRDHTLGSDIEYDGYWPDHDENFSHNTIEVSKKDNRVFWQEFIDEEHLNKHLSKYLKSLRHVC